MANLNKVLLIGRLTRDPESRTFTNGGKVTKFGFAVNYLLGKKNQETGQWEGAETAFVDVEVFNREFRQLADLVEQRCRKGTQLFLEGRLRLNEWQQDGQKRTKLLVVADNIEFLDAREGGGSSGMGSASGEGVVRGPRNNTPAPGPKQKMGYSADSYESESEGSSSGGGGEDDIPF